MENKKYCFKCKNHTRIVKFVGVGPTQSGTEVKKFASACQKCGDRFDYHINLTTGKKTVVRRPY